MDMYCCLWNVPTGVALFGLPFWESEQYSPCTFVPVMYHTAFKVDLCLGTPREAALFSVPLLKDHPWSKSWCGFFKGEASGWRPWLLFVLGFHGDMYHLCLGELLVWSAHGNGVIFLFKVYAYVWGVGVRVLTSQTAQQTGNCTLNKQSLLCHFVSTVSFVLPWTSLCPPWEYSLLSTLSSLGLPFFSTALLDPLFLLRSSQPHLQQHSYKTIVLTWGQYSPQMFPTRIADYKSG